MLLNRWFAPVHFRAAMLKTLGFPKTLLKVIANSLMPVMVIVLKCGMKAKWSVVYMVSALAKAVFPKGTAGCQLDVLAREPLWIAKRNFGHGTGHGVGFYLNVHEGPQDIRQNFNRQALIPGMITSDEPGIYREGKFGIRHENLILCVDAGENDFGHWLRFETLTLCHFDTSILVKDLLDRSEIDWLNAYNEHVYRTLSPRLTPEVASWLRQKTLPI